MRNATVIIPAHLGSSRVRRKCLLEIQGKTLLQRCFESVLNSGFTPYIATADEEILNVAEGFGAEVILTSEEPRNGTERVAEACRFLRLAENDIIVNVQSDMWGWTSTDFITAPIDEMPGSCGVTTIYSVLHAQAYPIDLRREDVVKVLEKPRGNGLGFATFTREPEYDPDLLLGVHYGVYAYLRGMLEAYLYKPVSRGEKRERLEQLRWDVPIKAVPVYDYAHKIDTPEDIRLGRWRG